MKNIDIDKVQDVVNHWDNRLPMMIMEEAGALIQAISTFDRASTYYEALGEDEYAEMRKAQKKSEIAEQNLIDEIGAMYVSLLAIRLYYDLDLSKIEERIDENLNKEY